MAVVARGGRFASLPIEDDRERQVKKTEVKDADKTKKKRKKKKTQTADGDLQTMIFGGSKNKPLVHLPSPTSPPPSLHRDTNQKEVLQAEPADQFSSDMREALIQSDLEYKLELDSKAGEVRSKVEFPPETLLSTDYILSDTCVPKECDSLFPDKYLSEIIQESESFPPIENEIDKDGGEFKEIKRKTKKNKVQHNPHTFQHLPLVVELTTSSTANFAQVIELEKKLTDRNNEINVLMNSKDELQLQIQKLTKDNSALTNLLSQAEIRSKADMIQEIEGITLEKVEMANELQKLSEALEQERTRTKTIRTELQRIQNKK